MRRHQFALFAAILPCLALSQCGGTSPRAQARIAYARLPGFALVHIAREKEFFAAQGLNVEFLEFSLGKDALKAMLDGSADFAATYEAPLVMQACSGKEFHILTTLHMTPDGTAVVARKDAGVAAPQDLRKKRVGVTQGTNADYFLQRFMLFEGLPATEVTIVPLAAGDNVSALREHRVDAIATWTPLKEQAMELLGAQATSFPSDSYTEVSFLVANPDVPDTTSVRVLRALEDAEEYRRESPGSAMDILRRTMPGVSPNVQRVMSGFTFSEGLNHLSLRTLDDVTQWTLETRPEVCIDTPRFRERMRLDLLRSVDPRSVMID